MVAARSPAVEVAGVSGADDDDAIAYAWFAEDDGASEARAVRRGAALSSSRIAAREVEGAGASGADDDDAIAYAWFAEDDVEDAALKREVEGAGASGADDDDAIAYAWFAEDEE